MKKSNVDTRSHRIIYNFNHIVGITEVEQNGWLLTTFKNEDYVNIGNGLVLRRPRTNSNLLNNPVAILPIAEILDRVKSVRNLHGDLIYKKKHSREPLRKVTFVKKSKIFAAN